MILGVPRKGSSSSQTDHDPQIENHWPEVKSIKNNHSEKLRDRDQDAYTREERSRRTRIPGKLT